eukprot:GEMP01014664.1.p1 GENE.GEMP01014664.1~~GEMP01014664.1.p1  ORF type:complete len:633 (+),score=151.13 GEMP01014664.1:112-2010(+)
MSEHRIEKLEEHVINRIAAGEIIVRPSSAVKELVENSLDAGATSIVITCQKGGMKALRIEDDGHGIRAVDLPILCQRFTTSKLRNYEDLRAIGTFGFRGEALSSISHVAHVSVVTRTKDDAAARNVTYHDGVMQGEPKVVPGRGVGTTIVFEDLFYNMETRRKVVTNMQDEYNKIVEVTQKYATHNPATSFMCKKFQGTVADLRTLGGVDHKEVVERVYGHALAKELLEYSCSSPSPSLVLEARGLVSNCNWSSKKMELLLFINNRLVESSSIKRMIDLVYSINLPKGAHPWVYLSIQLDPKTLDVNVHPTKKEVQFLEEELILEHLRAALEKLLENTKESRVFQMMKETRREKRKADGPEPEPARIRVDTMQLRINDMSRQNDLGQKNSDWVCPAESADLWQAVQNRRHPLATQTITRSVWVGIVDDQLALVQFGSSLHMINMFIVGQEFAYQMLLHNCGSQARCAIEPACSLKDVFVAGIRDPASGFTGTDERMEDMWPEFEQWAEGARDVLRPFGYDIADGVLRCFPKVFPFSPMPRPLLLLRLWKSKGSLEEYLQITARDAVEAILDLPESEECPRVDLPDPESKLLAHKLWELVHLSFFSAIEDYLTDGTITRIVALEQLYKVFERC